MRMKKLFFALMAVAAITLTSCLGKTETPGQGDQQVEAPEEASDLVSALQSQLDAGNGEGFFALVTNIQEKAISFIKENPAKAQEYLGTAQQFLKDNAAKIGELVGKITNSDVAERAQELIKSVSEQPVSQLLGIVGAADQVQDAVGEQVDEVTGAVEEKVGEVTDKVNEGYNSFDFHIAYHALHNFCAIDMSSFYLDILKDRLYCEPEKSELRRAAQTTMYRVLSAIARLSAPIISFTAEEIWQFMPHSSADDKQSVFLNQMPEKSGIEFTPEFVDRWSFIYSTREAVNKVLEEKRNEKFIGKSLEAEIIVHSSEADYNRYADIADHLSDILIVSGVTVEKSEGETTFEVVKAKGNKCERCWCYSITVGEDSEHPTLCKRCAAAIRF